MHHAPAASFPLERSRFLGRLLILAWGIGAGTVMLWVEAQQHCEWPQWLGVAAVFLGGTLARHWWKLHPVGELGWDGQVWHIRLPGGSLLKGQVSVHLDLQRHLLLTLTCGRPGSQVWLWLDEQANAQAWRDLRRAVYSRAKEPSDADRLPGSEPP